MYIYLYLNTQIVIFIGIIRVVYNMYFTSKLFERLSQAISGWVSYLDLYMYFHLNQIFLSLKSFYLQFQLHKYWYKIKFTNLTMGQITPYGNTTIYTNDNFSFDESDDYGGRTFAQFASGYEIFHKPLVVSICAFGSAANALNAVILTRPCMRTAVNVILTALSLNQLFLLINYFLLTMLNYLAENCVLEGEFYWR